MVRRHGWMLPAHYGDMEREYAALRGGAVVADRSHASRIMVTGTDAGEVLAATFAGHVDELEEGRAMRAVWLDGAGRIGDLALIARTGGIAYMVAGERSRRAHTLQRLDAARGGDWDVRVDDRTESTCLLSPPARGLPRSSHATSPMPDRAVAGARVGSLRVPASGR
jgi:glycine cleavage system aminomethyltransferase T